MAYIKIGLNQPYITTGGLFPPRYKIESLENIKIKPAPHRLIGEIVFQLENRMFRYVFGRARHVVGVSVCDVDNMILRECTNLNSGIMLKCNILFYVKREENTEFDFRNS